MVSIEMVRWVPRGYRLGSLNGYHVRLKLDAPFASGIQGDFNGLSPEDYVYVVGTHGPRHLLIEAGRSWRKVMNLNIVDTLWDQHLQSYLESSLLKALVDVFELMLAISV